MAAAHRIRWDRVGRWALLCVFALRRSTSTSGPPRTWVSTSREAKRKRAEVADAAGRERAAARAQAPRSSSAGALEREARRLGMVKAGEKLYVVK